MIPKRPGNYYFQCFTAYTGQECGKFYNGLSANAEYMSWIAEKHLEFRKLNNLGEHQSLNEHWTVEFENWLGSLPLEHKPLLKADIVPWEN